MYFVKSTFSKMRRAIVCGVRLMRKTAHPPTLVWPRPLVCHHRQWIHTQRHWLAASSSSTEASGGADESGADGAAPQPTSPTEPNDLVINNEYGNGILCVGLHRPAAKNALRLNLMHELSKVVDDLKEDESVRVLILHSTVKGVFCAGADLKERLTMADVDVGPLVSQARDLFHRISELPMPTLCALDGVAFGGGLEMALACDLRYASQEAMLGLVETKLAILPGAGGTQRLPHLVGVSRAKELIFLGKRITGAEAAQLGVVNAAVPQNEAGDAAFQLCLQHARTMATECGPVALRWCKVAVDRGVEFNNWTDKLEMEDVCYSQVIGTEDRVEGLKAFAEKRKPVYTGK